MNSRLVLDLELPLARFALRVRLASSARALGVFGPSGAGKTSLLETLAGWRRPHAGRIEFDGRAWFDAAARVDVAPGARRVGYVPQDALLFPHLDARANVLAGAAAGEDELFRRAVDVLELAPLLAQRPASLSGGERQRVALARALCSRPALLLLDEPLASLDLALRRRILPWLVRVRESFDVPLVFVSHDPTEVQALCDQVAVLDAGSVRELGPPREVLRRAEHATAAFENVLAGRVLSVRDGAADVLVGAGLVFRVPAGEAREGDELLFAVDADDVLLAAERVARISARNVLAARVERVVAAEGAERVDLALGPDGRGPGFSAALTSAAVRELAVVPGAAMHVIVKTQSCRVLATTRAAADQAASRRGGSTSITT